ncbi:PAS domain S-box-containing protein/diguanylate cyclase (GGDEF) domain-containing protein [Geoalkalibacter ferrihydriticus]|uniref:PAS domain S-box-containing protein/diguanylate cyclase (GGDEF) domain-containing protein n=1 Tax=Geoalkalibacter ferrihydriticus TaxID=392333 RepID=A0A1G9LSY0_9BACT|nr:bifunctional diguanylate cyclase/phosphodiesterase [Geoalkalibacter ferrihydriticus]SDL65069.1 PAS domain S-box-containing protein/diguanylate cyclase (GGDEF) domain-containing protein [Geoalkalibacter ferrihydriticus]
MDNQFLEQVFSASGPLCLQRMQCPELGFLQSILDAMPNPVVLKARDGSYLGCNQEMEKWAGMSRQELLGKSPLDIFGRSLADLCLENDRKVFDSGKPCSYGARITSFQGCEKEALVFKAPLYQLDGTVAGVVTTLVDVSDLKTSQRQLQESGEFWKTILDEMSDAVAIIDGATRKIISANKVFLRQFGVSANQVLGGFCHDIVFPGERDQARAWQNPCPLNEAIVTGRATLMEHQLSLPDGQRWLEVSTTPIKDEGGNLKYLVHVCRDVTARKKAEREIERLACFDQLTDLPNRTLLLDRLHQAISLAGRDERMLAVLFLDLDHFKKINDSLGYSVGDSMLQAIAQRLRQCVRASDTLSRIGGDDFVVLLNSIHSENDVLSVVRHLQEALVPPVRVGGQEFHLDASIGISLFPHDGDKAQDLLRTAELAMHEAKNAGRNNYKFFSSQMNSEAFERLRMEVDLRRALREDELFVVYQPQLDLTTRRVCGVEALVRWHHPQLGVVSPARFIPLAEETGLILPLGEWVLREACSQIRAWQKAGLNDLRLGVNLSPVQFRQAGLVATVRDILAETGLAASSLELELTESVLMEKGRAVKDSLDEFKTLGIRLSLDDFGTGYSSLSYLKYFPIDRIKIAQEFVRDLLADSNHVEIVKAILAMAASFKFDVIAEGVENRDQFDMLVALGCREMQGYYFARPLIAKECFHLLQEWIAEPPGPLR